MTTTRRPAVEAPRGLASELADVLRGRILSGELDTGAQVPTEAALSDEFGVSRTVVREALQHLRASGLVESFQGRGTFVLAVPKERTGGPLDGVHSRAEIVELIDFRIGLETEAAALAAARHTPAQLAGVQRALEAFAALGGQPARIVEADFAFHRSVAQASNNRFYVSALEDFGPRMILLQRTGLDERSEVTATGHFATVLAEHGQIAAAIARGDAAGAAAAMRVHLSNSRARLRA